MEKQLDVAITKYVTPLAKKYGFSPTEKAVYGLGAYQDFEAANLLMRIVNDKGIVSIEVAPRSDPDKFRDIALFKEYLQPPKQGVLNLSLQQQADFLDDNWVWFNEQLSPQNYEDTLIGLHAAGKRRSTQMFGK